MRHTSQTTQQRLRPLWWRHLVHWGKLSFIPCTINGVPLDVDIQLPHLAIKRLEDVTTLCTTPLALVF